MSLSPRFLDEIRNRVTLSDIIGRRVKVTRAGREFKACCPFHKEKTPSFTINDDKQFYHCFGCGAHGDVIGFVMQHDNLSFIDAVEMLSADAGLQMPKPDPVSAQKAEKARDLHALMDAAVGWMSERLYDPANKEVLDYLYQRGFKRETLEAFRVGYAPIDRQQMRVYLKDQGYSDADMLEVGILKKSDKSPDPYVFFRDRVMFPVADRRGRIIAFGGRAMPEHIRPPQEGFTPPKYLNSSDTTLFDKSRTLYGEALARQAARDGKPVVVTEGYMDVIACHEAGFTGAVAPMGTALTDDQILMLWSMIPEDEKVPILCFDGDNAGRKAAARAAENILPLLKPGHSVRLAFMPDGEDPDSLIKSGGSAALQKILDGAISLLDFIWVSHTGGREFKTPEERAGISQTLRNHIAKVADGEVQAHYKALMNERISNAFFPKRQSGRGGGGNWKDKNSSRPRAIKPRALVFKDTYARILLAAILNHPSAFGHVEEAFGQFSLRNQILDNIRQETINALSNDPDLDRAGLEAHLIASGFEKEIGDILNKSVYVHAAFASPAHDSQEVAGKWIELWTSMQEQGLEQEVRAGWKQAFHNSNEEDENKLKQMVRANSSE